MKILGPEELSGRFKSILSESGHPPLNMKVIVQLIFLIKPKPKILI